MSNYHVKEVNKNGRNAVVVFHIPIPDENNSAGVSLRTAVLQWIKPINADGTFGIFQSSLQDIATAELTQLRNGELYEIRENVDFLAADKTVRKHSKIDDKYNSLAAKELDRIRGILMFWGKSRNLLKE